MQEYLDIWSAFGSLFDANMMMKKHITLSKEPTTALLSQVNQCIIPTTLVGSASS